MNEKPKMTIVAPLLHDKALERNLITPAAAEQLKTTLDAIKKG